MWATVLAKIVELGLAIFSALKSVAAAMTQWRATTLGEAEGRAESDAAHAEAAHEAGDRMQSIADKPATRDEMIRRLEEGSA